MTATAAASAVAARVAARGAARGAAASADAVVIVPTGEKRFLTRRCSVGINTHQSSNASPNWDAHQDRIDQ